MWNVLPWARFGEILELTLVSIAAATILRKTRGWAWVDGLAAFWGLMLVFFTGIAPVAATLLLAATGCAVGSLFVARRSAADVLIAGAVGIVLIAGGIGWLLPFPVHRRFAYLAFFVFVCIWRRHAVFDIGSRLRQGWRDAVGAAPLHAAAAVGAVGLALTGAWLPTMQSDDLAYHLGLPTQLQQNGFYALDASRQIWSLAPWLGDVVHGLAQVLAGREARGAVDSLWLLLAAATLGRLTMVLRADARLAWQAVAVFASLPIVAGLAGGMQTELPATALTAACALLILRRSDAGGLAVFGGAVLLGGLFGLKFGQLIAALILSIWACARIRGRIPVKRVAMATPLFLFVAGSSYFYAWHVSGNPMLPLFNNVFQSAVMPAQQLNDPRWHAGFNAFLPWSMTFETPRYADGEPGGYGFALVVYIGAWLLALWRRETRAYACMASAILVLPLLPMQYARYAFPGLVLLLPAATVVGDAALGVRHFSFVVYALCALNLAFQGNGPWPLPTVARKRLLTGFGDADVVLRRFAPERVLIAELRKRDPSNSIVLALDRQAAFVAELAGRGRTVSWYAPALDTAGARADADSSGALWQKLFDDTGVAWLLLRRSHLSEAQRAALATDAARRIDAIDDAELWAWKRPTERAAMP